MHVISQNGINIAVLDGDEDVEELLNIDGRRCVFKDEIFDLDSWHFDEAINYLVGIYSIYAYGNESGYPSLDSITTLEGLDYECSTGSLPFFRELSRRFDKVKKLWISGSHKERNSISYYIDWALSKKIDIHWLDYAIQKGFYSPEPEKELKAKERNNLYKLIGVLHDILTNYPLDALPNHPFDKKKKYLFETQDQLIKLIEDKYVDYKGLSGSQLDKIFPLAKASLK